MNRGKKLCPIFFDIASAFDKVWHKGLIFKLIKLKLANHLVSWIFDFRMNRFFSVIVGDFTKEKIPIRAGLPQGTVLSPLLLFKLKKKQKK
jgi:retron-type reverse transcriptase